jgi:regulator of replication initiation timing
MQQVNEELLQEVKALRLENETLKELKQSNQQAYD